MGEFPFRIMPAHTATKWSTLVRLPAGWLLLGGCLLALGCAAHQQAMVPAPTPTQACVATRITAGPVRLAWTAPAPPPKLTLIGYLLDRQIDAATTWEPLPNPLVTSTETTDATVQDGHRYLYRLRATWRTPEGDQTSDAASWGEPNPCVEVSAVASIPEHLTARLKGRTVTLRWDSKDPALPVVVQRVGCSGGDGDMVWEMTVTGELLKQQEPAAPRDACYRVRYANETAWTPVVQATPGGGRE